MSAAAVKELFEWIHGGKASKGIRFGQIIEATNRIYNNHLAKEQQ